MDVPPILDYRLLDAGRQRRTRLPVSLQHDMLPARRHPSFTDGVRDVAVDRQVRGFIEFGRRSVEIDHAIVSRSVR